MPYGIYDGTSVIAQFVAPLTVRSNHPVFASDTLSLSRRASRRTAQRWEIESRLEPLSATAQELFVSLVTKGYASAVSVVTPQNYGAIKARVPGSLTPRASGTAGTNIVTVTNSDNYIPKGTFIKFSNHTKIYLTTNNLSNNGSLGIYPDLKTTVNGLTPDFHTFVWQDLVLMTCYYDLDTVLGMSYSDGILMDVGSVKLVEAV